MNQGDTVTVEGVEYSAVSSPSACSVKDTPCAFHGVNGKACSDAGRKTSCHGVIWLTKQNYINHRLTT